MNRGKGGRDPEDLRAFARAEYAPAARELKARYWREFKEKYGMIAAFRLADELRRQVLLEKPGWPSEEERREDWEAHIRLERMFERASARRVSGRG